MQPYERSSRLLQMFTRDFTASPNVNPLINCTPLTTNYLVATSCDDRKSYFFNIIDLTGLLCKIGGFVFFCSLLLVLNMKCMFLKDKNKLKLFLNFLEKLYNLIT